MTINNRTILNNLIPAFLRKSTFLNFLYAIGNGLEYCNSNILEFIKYTNQTIYVTKYINDLYDPINRRIYLVTNSGALTYLYNKSEAYPDKTYLYNRSEAADKTYFKNRDEGYSDNGISYIVMIPRDLVGQSNQITKTVNLFNPADKNFQIQTIYTN